ncbi:MAG: chromosome segregation protein SMC [Acidimicrobiia bacterium]|nr:chromosome segregation protein SMC [Acidimicrobiia bacterium]
MFLKSIAVAGFKSFAKRTTLEFGPGITVIVGPNGSGKSNIVDAVAWATGSQATRTLRADRSDELLFCGTATLPASSRAEVTLVFDNTSGVLPIDRPEVSVTRRYHRSGESEFEINRVSCRLLDITELLAEAGIWKTRYALVGQGQIERVLNASPSEHRKVLEEAAGVGKHLWRRDKAVRRLESTGADLDRIADLIAEKQRRMRPLRRQAEALGRYQRLSGEIRALRTFLEGKRLRELDEELANAVASRKRWQERRSEAAADRERGVQALSEAESSLEDLRSDPADRALQDWEMATERMRRLSEVAALQNEALRRRRQMEALGRSLAEERVSLEQGMEKVDGEIASCEQAVEIARSAQARLAGEERRLAVLKGAGAEAELGGLENELAGLEAAWERDLGELEGVEARLSELAATAERLESGMEEAEQALAGAEALHLSEEEEMKRAARRARETRRQLRAAEERAAEARAAMAEATGRLEAARAAMKARDPARRSQVEALSGWTGWVSQLLSVPEELAAAVEAALERWAEAGVFEGPVGLGNAVDRLGEAGGPGGPVSMVSLRFPGRLESSARSAALSGSRFKPLLDLLEEDPQAALAMRLLGDVVVVEDWRTGWEVVGSHPHLRAVTRRGDLITARGIRLCGGVRLPDLAAAVANAEEAGRSCEHLREELRRVGAEARSGEEAQEESTARWNERRRSLLESQQRRDRVESRWTELQGQSRRLEERRDSLREEQAARRSRMAELKERITRLRGRRVDAAGEARRLAERLERASEDRVAAEEEHRSRITELSRLREERRLGQARHEKVVMELTRVSFLPEEAPDHSEEVAELAAAALGVMSARREALVSIDRASKERFREVAAESGRIREAIGQADETERRATGELEGLIAEVSRLESRRQAVTESLRMVGADPTEAVTAPVPETEDPEGTLRSLVAELERAGPMNHYAALDLSELESEVSELSAQRDDIVESGERLGRVIAELEREATDRYLATFRETATSFERSFGQVFPGGRGRLRLVDSADPLGSGVEIRAQPSGKRVSRLSLLSGGERALGALAFLFAMMKTRPSPFYLLDEVDATLDSANLHRVLGMVRELSSEAQILVITHQPQTAESADLLYGVTMPPGGATRVVSVGMDQAGTGLPGLQPPAKSA